MFNARRKKPAQEGREHRRSERLAGSGLKPVIARFADSPQTFASSKKGYVIIAEPGTACRQESGGRAYPQGHGWALQSKGRGVYFHLHISSCTMQEHEYHAKHAATWR